MSKMFQNPVLRGVATTPVDPVDNAEEARLASPNRNWMWAGLTRAADRSGTGWSWRNQASRSH